MRGALARLGFVLRPIAPACRASQASCPLHLSINVDDSHPSTSGRYFSSASTDGHTWTAAELKQALLEAGLKRVSERGWTNAALVDAARELNLSPAVTAVLGPQGEGALVSHFMEQCNARLVELLDQHKDELQALELDARVAKALQLRLEMLVPYMDTWPQALAVAAKPANAGRSLKLLYQLVDDIWAALGDQATDTTWYTKRALVAGAYTATSLYMITDYSPGYRDTWAALRRRVAEGLALEGRLEALVHTAASAATATATGAAAGAADAQGGAAAASEDATQTIGGAAEAEGTGQAAAAGAGSSAEVGAGQGAGSSAGHA